MKIVLVTLALLAAASCARAAEDVTASLTDVRGVVEVQTAGSLVARPAKAGETLHAGDTVRVEQGDANRAALIVNDQPVVVAGGQRYTVAAEAPARSRGLLAWMSQKLSSLSDNDELISRPGAAGFRAVAAADRLVLLSPVNTRLTHARPVFRWKSARAGAFELRLMREGQVIWEKPTRETVVEYPADAPPLAPGATYFWTVTVKGVLQSNVEEAFLEVGTGAQLARLAAVERQTRRAVSVRSPGYQEFALGAAAEAAGFLEEADRHYQEALTREPASPLYVRALRDLDLHACRPIRENAK